MEQHKKTKTEEIHEGLNYIMIFLEEVNQFTKQNSPFYKFHNLFTEASQLSTRMTIQNHACIQMLIR